jgi:hypothetical protein
MQLETENFNPHSQQLSFTALNGAWHFLWPYMDALFNIQGSKLVCEVFLTPVHKSQVE